MAVTLEENSFKRGFNLSDAVAVLRFPPPRCGGASWRLIST
jgi:hypothetical protein